MSDRFLPAADVDRLVEAVTVAVNWLHEAPVSPEDIDRIWWPTRQQASRLYRLTSDWEADRLEWWYDLHDLISQATSLPHRSIGDVWTDLLAGGAITVRPKQLLKMLRDVGVNVERQQEDE